MTNTAIPTRDIHTSYFRNLVDGTFDGGDAKEIVHALINSQIQDCKVRSLRSMVNMDTPDPVSQSRMAQLRETLNEMRRFLSKASATGQSVRIRARLELELENHHS